MNAQIFRTHKLRFFCSLLAFLLLLTFFAIFSAQSQPAKAEALSAEPLAGTGYEITWWTVEGGGLTWSQNGGYSLGGTIGQPDAGVLQGNSYTLRGGFWAGTRIQRNLYLPYIRKN